MTHEEERDQQLLKLANAAGYLLQLRLAHAVKSVSSRDGWGVLSTEHRWLDHKTQREAFIDLILERSSSLIVIECKRSRDASWVFLEPQGSRSPTAKADTFWIKGVHSSNMLADWQTVTMRPPSREASFCVVRGQGDKNKGSSMLERLAAVALRSVEGVAAQEIEILRSPDFEHVQRFILPVIVTNADLYVCSFKTSDIELSTGDLPSADFEPVPYVRFRKSLPTGSEDPEDVLDLGQLNNKSERTVLVVGADHFTEFLKEHEVEALYRGA